jgi:mono/diheme cytochrome c family protein
MMLRHTLLIPCLVLALLAGCNRSDETGADTSTVAAGTDFLMFPNPQASLGVGDYSVQFTNTTFPTNPTPYTLTVTYTDGTVETYPGSWTAPIQAKTQPIEVKRAGGVTISLNSGGASSTLFLRVTGAATSIASTSGVNPSISLPRFEIDQAAYTNAYYTVLDLPGAKTTLAGFKTANSFNGTNCQPTNTVTVEEYEVKFRDVHDLGYGRHMCVHRNKTTGDIAVWVENFQVTAISSQHYGPLNLEAVINDDRRWHVGTNAIEYSTTPTSGVVKFVKFYTFNPDGTRRTLVDLDGRGAKAMPVPCISCHGGKALPLTAAGLFPIIAAFPRADTLAHMQPINVDTLDFSDRSPWTRAEQEASLKAINKIVLCSYPLPGAVAGPEDNCRTATVGAAQWQGTTAEMVKAWYGGNGMPFPTASDTYVPIGWKEPAAGGTAPAGATNLYQTVVAPNCRVCHALRGNANSPGANDIDFTEYQKFIGTNAYEGFAVGPAGGGHYNRILHHVFDKGNMPLALLKWEQFWDSTAPATLAALVPGATSGGTVLRPNRPVAIPGPDRRRLRTGSAIRFSAADSVNAVNYRWRVTSQPAGTPPTLTNINTVRPTFTPNVDGIYTVELIVNDGTSDSAPVTQTLVSAAANLDPNSIRWADIRNILQNTGGILPATPCTACHFVASGNNGPPVFYDDYDRDGDSLVNAADVHQFYLDMRARLNFTDVEASFLLRRPSGHHHPGGLLNGFDVDNQIGGNRTHYDTILNWIMNGAPE